MLPKSSDLRQFYEAGRPLVEQWLDLAEQFKGLRDAARVKDVDWAQIKALLKAEIEDAREGTDKRVRKILEKADNASSYAELLGIEVSEKNFSRGVEPIPQSSHKAPVETARWPASLQAPLTANDDPGRYEVPEDGGIPPFLRRAG